MALPFENQASVGRDVAVLFSLTASTTPPVDYTELAARRGLDEGAEWDTADTTAVGTSSGFVRTALVTYKGGNIELDGLVLINNQGQIDLEDHIRFPPAETNNQPNGWIKLVEPRTNGATRIVEYPVMFSSFRKSNAYDSERTWTITCVPQGDEVVTEVPA